MKFELLKDLLIIAMCSSIIVTNLVQKIKESCLNDASSCICISFVLSIITGTVFALSFSEVNIEYALWIGLFTFIGADTLYKTLEERVFTSFKSISNKEKETQSID